KSKGKVRFHGQELLLKLTGRRSTKPFTTYCQPASEIWLNLLSCAAALSAAPVRGIWFLGSPRKHDHSHRFDSVSRLVMALWPSNGERFDSVTRLSTTSR